MPSLDALNILPCKLHIQFTSTSLQGSFMSDDWTSEDPTRAYLHHGRGRKLRLVSEAQARSGGPSLRHAVKKGADVARAQKRSWNRARGNDEPTQNKLDAANDHAAGLSISRSSPSVGLVSRPSLSHLCLSAEYKKLVAPVQRTFLIRSPDASQISSLCCTKMTIVLDVNVRYKRGAQYCSRDRLNRCEGWMRRYAMELYCFGIAERAHSAHI